MFAVMLAHNCTHFMIDKFRALVGPANFRLAVTPVRDGKVNHLRRLGLRSQRKSEPGVGMSAHS